MKKINEVSRLVGVSRRTLQYYDDEGILSIERTSNNHRAYDQSALERIWQILIYKEMDFQLKEIKQLLRSDDVQKDIYFKQKIEAIKKQISMLKVQMNFISFVQINGMPERSEEHSGKTYVKCVEEIREKIQREMAGIE